MPLTDSGVRAVLRGTGCTGGDLLPNGFRGVYCGTAENKLRLLESLAHHDLQHDLGARRALAKIKAPSSPMALAEVLHAHVRDTVPFIAERVETFKSTGRTLREGGDCDDSARALVVLARLAGIRARYMPITQCRHGTCAKTHVAAQLLVGRRWYWAETTMDAVFGEHPLAAYRRLKAEGRAPVARPDLGMSGLGAVEAPAPTLLAIPGIEKTSDAFRRGLLEVAGRLEVNADHLSAVISIESGYNPAAQNPSSKATGLIQFMPATAKALGTTVDALRAMSAVDQLVYVEKYFKPFTGKLKLAEDVYVAVFTPVHVGKGSANVISSRGEKIYESNRVLDKNRDGVITNGDLGAWVEERLTKGRERPPIVVGEGPSGSGGGRWPYFLFGGLTVVGIGYAIWDAFR